MTEPHGDESREREDLMLELRDLVKHYPSASDPARSRLEGLARAQLWCTILLESLLLLGAGCIVGALFGLYGRRLADRALAQTINFPVAHSLSPLPALASIGLVIAAALAVLALPGYLATGVPASVAPQE